MSDLKKLVVIPSDPIEAYERKGLDWLESYYNPTGFFDEVYALSPIETRERFCYGMHIKPVTEDNYKRTLAQIKPNVVRAYGGYWACDLACHNKIYNTPVVVSVHDSRNEMLHSSIRRADMVICMSNIVANLVSSRGVNNDRVRILPNRVDRDLFSPKNKEDCLSVISPYCSPRREGSHILHIGRKVLEKNIATVVTALTILPAEYSAIFVGAGDAEPYIRLARECGVDGRCYWIESIPNSVLPYLYSWADCFCTPSLSEGFGLVFIEAAACGSAIITSDIAPMNEYLVHDQSALLVKEYENPHKIADAIHFVCANKEYRERISGGAREASQVFDKKTIDSLEVSLYKEISTITYLGKLKQKFRDLKRFL